LRRASVDERNVRCRASVEAIAVELAVVLEANAVTDVRLIEIRIVIVIAMIGEDMAGGAVINVNDAMHRDKPLQAREVRQEQRDQTLAELITHSVSLAELSSPVRNVCGVRIESLNRLIE
jgi:hypothetical protein